MTFLRLPLSIQVLNGNAKNKTRRLRDSFKFCGERGITFGDRLGRTLQTLNEPFGFYFFHTQFLQKASFLRSFGKINNPAACGIHLSFAERGGFEPPVPF
jgi:hypothetical protein